MFPRLECGFSRTLLVAGFVLVAPWMALAQWAIETVIQGHRLDQGSLKVDALGRPVIVFGGSSLELARWDGAAWVLEEVDVAPCSFAGASLALDGAGNPAIS